MFFECFLPPEGGELAFGSMDDSAAQLLPIQHHQVTPIMSYKIAVLGGDGTGPEVAREGVKVLEAIAQQEELRRWFGRCRRSVFSEILCTRA